ncbi:hypothetical protein FACS189485_13620 [Spirochaetia bacterium]|nr:hypothetical protein FACS189485_13620 [Spirochaetia bacterium]
MAASLLPGCKTQKPKQEAAEPAIPLRPISRDIIQMARENGADLKDFQFYISETIELVNEKNAKSIDVDQDGSVIVRTITMPKKIRINKETMGKYIVAIPSQNDPTLFEICFDENNEKNTLFFRMNPDGTCYELLYTGIPLTTKYGKETYNLSIPGSTNLALPRLLIRMNEKVLTRSDVQVAPGSSVRNNRLTGSAQGGR